jgi:hypothetical protein
MQTVTTIGLDIAKCRPENKAAPVLGVTGAASCDGSPDRCLGRKPRSSPDPTIEGYHSPKRAKYRDGYGVNRTADFKIGFLVPGSVFTPSAQDSFPVPRAARSALQKASSCTRLL